MSSQQQADSPPARAPWPPILMALALLAGLALDHFSGWGFRDFPALQLLGALVVVLALANDIWCARLFARHNTTILPHRAATHLVTEGPFRWSRNPIYVSHVALIFGLGLLLSSPFTLLSTPLLALLLQKLSIEPEEQRLTAKFEDQYRAYMARTRRWL